MTARWYTLEEVAAATGLPARTLRDLLDKDRISYVQWEHNGLRRLTDDTLKDLERLGIPVNRALLERGKNGRNGKNGKSSHAPADTEA